MKPIIMIILISCIFANGFARENPPNNIQTARNDYINMLVKKYHFNKQLLDQWFAKQKMNTQVIADLNTPYEEKPWQQYKDLFLTKSRLQTGLIYWHQNAKILARAEKVYGVPASVIIAIIGIETKYGEYLGNFPTFNTLYTISFDYPSRAKFFRHELTDFLLLTRQEKLNPLTIKGSYAGALGYPQFMPSSYLRYGVDFSHNGKINLFNNNADIIGSVANFFSKHGWQKGQPIAVKVTVKNPTMAEKYLEMSHGYQLNLDLATLKANGIVPQQPIQSNLKTALINLGNDKATDDWLVFHNFKTIMNYNSSPKYAMVVYLFSQELQKAYGAAANAI